ncbi:MULTISPECIES: glycosyltransferase family 2 protein [unclassified Bifidobacterium]|uniref:glycosyltransferase family 2 protein n=1 Tax=unclassified Bifidobacterium TaxID=2608897 RepID=UPI00226B8C14|nr:MULTISPECIES: glycosyltransferase family 2 protein [unclassified Bifidobacterium]
MGRTELKMAAERETDALTMSVLAGMVTYDPDLSDLKTAIPSILDQCGHLVIVDNGSRQIEAMESLLSRYPNLVLIKNGRNLGVAAALNQIFSWAQNRGFQWVLTLDDDSCPPPTMLQEYCRHLAQAKGERVGIVCPLLENRRDGTIFHSKRSEDECITSGSLTSVEAWKSLGGFDEWLFIDGVDFDFSRRLVAAGYSIEECSSVIMPHQIGQSRTIHILGRNPIIWNHSAFRQYYIQRNAIYVDYKMGTYSFLSSLWRFIKDLVFVLVWEDDKWTKMLAMVHGWRAGMASIRGMSRS